MIYRAKSFWKAHTNQTYFNLLYWGQWFFENHKEKKKFWRRKIIDLFIKDSETFDMYRLLTGLCFHFSKI